MGLVSWWRKRTRAQEREAQTMAEMRRADEPAQPVPVETYMSQTRD
jgi:hypothetical protein